MTDTGELSELLQKVIYCYSLGFGFLKIHNFSCLFLLNPSIPTQFPVLEAVKSTALHSVKAILLGRLGKHSQALQVLVHQEQNLQAALVYCHRASRDQEPQFKQALMMDLLQIYLDSEELINNAVDLLNDNPQAFTAQTVIQLLPDSWSVQLLSRFLVRSVRATVHQRRMVKLQKMLVQAELRRHKVAWVSLITYSTFSIAVNMILFVLF